MLWRPVAAAVHQFPFHPITQGYPSRNSMLSHLKHFVFCLPELFLSENRHGVTSLKNKTLIILYLLPTISLFLCSPFLKKMSACYSVILLLLFLSNPFQLGISLHHPVRLLLPRPLMSLHCETQWSILSSHFPWSVSTIVSKYIILSSLLHIIYLAFQDPDSSDVPIPSLATLLLSIWMLLFTISISKYEVPPRLRFETLVFLQSFPRPVVVMDWTVSLPKLICWGSLPHGVMVFGDGATGDILWIEWGHMGRPWFNGIGILIRGGRSV